MRGLLWRLFDWLNRGRRERQLTDEIRSHLDDLIDDHVDRGLTLPQARAAAHRAFGGVERVKDAYRDQRGGPVIEALWFDVRHAARLLTTARGFSGLVVIILGLGIAVANTAFTLTNAHTLRGLPIPQPDRVLFLGTQAPAGAAGISYLDFRDLQRATTSFEALGAYAAVPAVVISDGVNPAERLAGTYLSAGAFRALGESPIRGAEFLPTDDDRTAPMKAILGAAIWRSRYYADDGIVGKAIEVNGVQAVVTGVMRDGLRFPANAEIWLPLAKAPAATSVRSDRTLSVYGRLRPGVSDVAGRLELDAIAADLSGRYPETHRSIRFTSMPINDRFNGGITDPVWLAFLTAGIIVFLVSCANAANLLLMRAAARTREIAVRASIGASRARIVRQLLVECTLIAVLAGGLGLALSVGAVYLLAGSIPQSAAMPYWIQYTPDRRVLWALIALCVSTVFLCGLVPALRLARVPISRELHEGGRSQIGTSRTRRSSAVLVALEFGLSLVLLIGVSMNLDGFRGDTRVDVAVEESPLLTGSLTLPAARYQSAEQRMLFYEGLLARLRAIQPVAAAAVASHAPSFGGARAQQLRIAGLARYGPAAPVVQTVLVSTGYFETLDVALRKGRPFGATDGIAGAHTAIVNERFEQLYFPSGDAIGQTVALVPVDADTDAPSTLRVVGVAPIIRQRRGTESPDGMALGAGRGRVVWLVLRRASVQLIAGLGVGLVFAFLFYPLLGDPSRASEVTQTVVMLPVVAAMLVGSLVACAVPAWRAARLDPAQTLRRQ